MAVQHVDLVPQPGMEPTSPAAEVQSLDRWPTRQVSGPISRLTLMTRKPPFLPQDPAQELKAHRWWLLPPAPRSGDWPEDGENR